MIDKPKKARSRSQSTTPLHKAPPAYFLSIEVERVLCFKDRQIIDFSNGNGKPSQWTVILGDNSVGKTTLLRCLSSIEKQQSAIYQEFYADERTPLFAILSPKSFLPWQELETLQKAEAKISALIVQGLKLGQLSSNPGLEPKKISVKSFIESNVETVDIDTFSREFVSLVCFGYGAARNMGKATLSERNFPENSASLFADDQFLVNAEEWLLQTDYAARFASGEIRTRLEKQLNHIIEVLKHILPDIEDIRIETADEEIPRPRAEFLTPYGWVRLSGLGLGYRASIAWMVDLAVRLFRQYPDSDDPLAEPAIVLVDEIDLHLHPKWQRTIMDFLTQRFPNTQFIVTAHSPLVVQAAKDANIVLLRREGDRVVIDNDPEIVDNWRVDQVLTSVFELPSARPSDLDPLLTRRKELLTQASLSESDETELRELESRIGSLPTAETPDDIKAMDIIRRAAQLLENS